MTVGGISIEAGSAGANVFVMQGEHEFQAPINLVTDANVQVVDGVTLILNNRLNLNGNTLAKIGRGELAVRNDLVTGSGTIDVQGGSLTGNGTIGGDLVNGAVVSPGNSAALVGAVVPEPGSFVLMIFGLVGLTVMWRHSK